MSNTATTIQNGHSNSNGTDSTTLTVPESKQNNARKNSNASAISVQSNTNKRAPKAPTPTPASTAANGNKNRNNKLTKLSTKSSASAVTGRLSGPTIIGQARLIPHVSVVQNRATRSNNSNSNNNKNSNNGSVVPAGIAVPVSQSAVYIGNRYCMLTVDQIYPSTPNSAATATNTDNGSTAGSITTALTNTTPLGLKFHAYTFNTGQHQELFVTAAAIIKWMKLYTAAAKVSGEGSWTDLLNGSVEWIELIIPQLSFDSNSRLQLNLTVNQSTMTNKSNINGGADKSNQPKRPTVKPTATNRTTTTTRRSHSPIRPTVTQHRASIVAAYTAPLPGLPSIDLIKANNAKLHAAQIAAIAKKKRATGAGAIVSPTGKTLKPSNKQSALSPNTESNKSKSTITPLQLPPIGSPPKGPNSGAGELGPVSARSLGRKSSVTSTTGSSGRRKSIVGGSGNSTGRRSSRSIVSSGNSTSRQLTFRGGKLSVKQLILNMNSLSNNINSHCKELLNNSESISTAAHLAIGSAVSITAKRTVEAEADLNRVKLIAKKLFTIELIDSNNNSSNSNKPKSNNSLLQCECSNSVDNCPLLLCRSLLAADGINTLQYHLNQLFVSNNNNNMELTDIQRTENWKLFEFQLQIQVWAMRSLYQIHSLIPKLAVCQCKLNNNNDNNNNTAISPKQSAAPVNFNASISRLIHFTTEQNSFISEYLISAVLELLVGGRSLGLPNEEQLKLIISGPAAVNTAAALIVQSTVANTSNTSANLSQSSDNGQLAIPGTVISAVTKPTDPALLAQYNADRSPENSIVGSLNKPSKNNVTRPRANTNTTNSSTGSNVQIMKKPIIDSTLIQPLFTLLASSTVTDSSAVYSVMKNIVLLLNTPNNSRYFLSIPKWQLLFYHIIQPNHQSNNSNNNTSITAEIYKLTIAILSTIHYDCLCQYRDDLLVSGDLGLSPDIKHILLESITILNEYNHTTANNNNNSINTISSISQSIFSGLLNKLKSRSREFTCNFDFTVKSVWIVLFSTTANIEDYLIHSITGSTGPHNNNNNNNKDKLEQLLINIIINNNTNNTLLTELSTIAGLTADCLYSLGFKIKLEDLNNNISNDSYSTEERTVLIKGAEELKFFRLIQEMIKSTPPTAAAAAVSTNTADPSSLDNKAKKVLIQQFIKHRFDRIKQRNKANTAIIRDYRASHSVNTNSHNNTSNHSSSQSISIPAPNNINQGGGGGGGLLKSFTMWLNKDNTVTNNNNTDSVDHSISLSLSSGSSAVPVPKGSISINTSTAIAM